MTALLEHLRVLDLARNVAGAYCTKLFADAGAEVIKIESDADPDPLRPPGDGEDGDVERAALFAHLNTSKKSVEIDVTNDAGRSQLLALAATAQVVVEDRPPGALAALGLGYEALRDANRAMVLTSITPFGQSGPYRDYRADELLVYAMGARMSTTGIQPRPPVRLAPESSAYLAGAAAAGATLTALWPAAEDGEGDHIDISMVECLLGAPDRHMLQWQYSRLDEPRIPAPRPLQNFPCKDGYFAIGLARGLQYAAQAMGRPELVEDERFATARTRAEHAAELDAIISAWTLQHTRRELFEQLQRHRVISGPINTVADLLNDPQFTHRGSFVALAVDGREYRVPGRPYREGNAHPGPLASPPARGEQTQEVLSRLGLMEQPSTPATAPAEGGDE
jgi:formyl-CoA transferase